MGVNVGSCTCCGLDGSAFAAGCGFDGAGTAAAPLLLSRSVDVEADNMDFSGPLPLEAQTAPIAITLTNPSDCDQAVGWWAGRVIGQWQTVNPNVRYRLLSVVSRDGGGDVVAPIGGGISNRANDAGWVNGVPRSTMFTLAPSASTTFTLRARNNVGTPDGGGTWLDMSLSLLGMVHVLEQS